MFDKQIVFSDYDGTIYITEESMENNVKAIEKYRNKGGKFVIVTGRSKTSVSNVIKQYNIPFDYIISNNGAVVFNKHNEKIYEQSIKPEVSIKIIEYLKTKGNIEVFFYDDGDKVEYKNQELLKIRIRTSNYKLAQNIEDEINEKFKEHVKAHSAFPGMYYDNHDFVIVDVVSKDAGKDNAIKKLVEMLNLDKKNVATIGDGRNDISMIKEYNGFSMVTAEEGAKKVASIIFENIADALEYIIK